MELRKSWSCPWHHHATLDNKVAEGKRGDSLEEHAEEVEAGTRAKMSFCVWWQEQRRHGWTNTKHSMQTLWVENGGWGCLINKCLALQLIITAESFRRCGPLSTIGAATHSESLKRGCEENAPFGEDTKMISPNMPPHRPSPTLALGQPKHWGI